MAKPSDTFLKTLIAQDPLFGGIEIPDFKRAGGFIKDVKDAVLGISEYVAPQEQSKSKPGPFKEGSYSNFQNPDPEKKALAEKRRWLKKVEQMQVSLDLEHQKSTMRLIEHQEIEAEIRGMSETEVNKSLHVSLDFRRKNTQTAYHRAETRNKLIEQKNAAAQAEKPLAAPRGKAKQGAAQDLRQAANSEKHNLNLPG